MSLGTLGAKLGKTEHNQRCASGQNRFGLFKLYVRPDNTLQ